MNTGSKPSGAARLPNGTNPSMCMYQVRGTRWGASLGGKGGFQCASPIPFLLFCGPSYYWEAVCLKKPFFFWRGSVLPEADSPFAAPPRSQALAARRNCTAWGGRGPGEVALRIPSGHWGSWLLLGPPVGQTHGWGRQGCSRDAPACGSRPPPRRRTAEPPPPDLWGHPSAPKKRQNSRAISRGD